MARSQQQRRHSSGMAKDKGSISVEASGGGSRAAKKRRKQKGKAAASDNHVPPATTSGGSGGGGNKRRREETSTPTHFTNGQQPQQQRPQQRLPSAGNGSLGDGSGSGNGGGSSSGSGSGSSSRRAGRDHQQPARTVIDASAADDRSRVLLELDAQGVLSDPDVESGLKARQLLQWMVAPLPVEEFYSTYW